MSFFSWKNQTLILHCYCQPKASKDEIIGEHNGALRIRLNAPPQDGKANQQLIQFLAKQCNVAKSAVVLVKGQSSRHKVVHIEQPNQLPFEESSAPIAPTRPAQ